ncbi:hypothetical protein [Lacunimicrobium album]
MLAIQKLTRPTAAEIRAYLCELEYQKWIEVPFEFASKAVIVKHIRQYRGFDDALFE